jgi:O-methyltransferase involved in polyketide biosynthesis
MTDKHVADLGPVQETLFIPLAARARETRKKRPILRDPKAVEMAGSIDYDAVKYRQAGAGAVVILRTAIFDSWVRAFLAQHPDGTVVEIGTGLNTRFERVDNGRVHWIDLDLPDTIELRRKFFTDSGRRQMLAASVLDDEWLQAVRERPEPYFFIADGVLVYLPEDAVSRTLAGIAERFPVVDSATITRPPRPFRAQLPPRYRYLLPLADPLLGKALRLTLFQASSPPLAQ